MGINGLLPLLKSIHKSCNLRKFEGKTLGVDAYGWLHRGTVACAMELAMGKPTKKFVEFAMHRVRMLQHFGVIPFIIFDGDYLPSKAATEADREKRREQSRKAGMELLNAGKTSQAYLEFQKSVDVTPEMARQLIDELKRTGVQYIVAPYEADAQMVYLERKGIIDGILSEDSDLLVFGAKCLLTKLDQYGNCVEINKADFSACKEITLTGWSDREFRTMAILSGCDYLASINNMGLKTAYRMVRKHKTIEKVIRMLSFDGKFHVPKTYLEQFRQAEFTFLHQRVFCPQARTLVLHTTPEQPLDLDKMPFLGADIEPGIAQGVARGDLNPMTKKPIVNHTRNNMVTSMDPWATSRPRNNKPSPLDLMKGVPISTFFKKRIPLAELPLNMLTGSPEQQDVLRRNSGPWIAQAAPSTTLNISTTSPQFPQSAPLISRSQPANHRTTRAPTISEPRPPKRARLCADIDTALSPSKEAELGPSRFFNAVPEPSPSVSRNARGKKAKKQDFNIFSDDGIEEAMLSLANVDDDSANGKASGKKIAVFAEMVTARSEALTIFDDHGCEMDKAEPRGCTPGMTLSESSSSSFSQPPTPTSPCQIPNSMSKLKEQFSFGGAAAVTPKGTGNLAFPPTPASSVSRRQSRIPLPVKIAATTPKLPAVSALVTRKPLTPLQRLGATAASRTNLPGTPPMTPATLPLKVRSPHRSLLGKCSIPFPEAVEAGKENATNPASVPLPVADDMEKNLLSMGAGSEDFIIHESEDDSDISLGAGETGTKSRFDFGRFIYSA